ncbi:MAG: hypothetical protein FJ096_15150 [Deltaproteobacteria bacterium]|nr:hypothetical protein [Deltaproteobacteria bacterium]
MQSHASRLTALGLMLVSATATADEPRPAAPGAEPGAPAASPAVANGSEAPAPPPVPMAPPTPQPTWPVAQPVPAPAPATPIAGPFDPRVIGVPAVPIAPPPPVFPSMREDEAHRALAGIEAGEVYLRDRSDTLRLYPSARLSLDLHANPGAPDIATSPIDTRGLGPVFFVRRATFEVSGEFGSRLSFTAGVELGGGRVGSTEYVGPSTPRLAMASAHTGRVLPADAHVSYRFRRWLNLTAGQQLLPFSMSNRTPDWTHPLPERPLAIRGFAAPWHRDVGLSVWGEAAPKQYLHYELGVFGGDGYEHVFADALPEFAGRIYSRPFSGLGAHFPLARAQFGLSARIGSRAPERVAYDYPTIATGQGWVLWQPGYVDSLGRTTHVLPSGLQRALGGELRLPFDLPGGRALDLQGEAYYVENGTREAVAGFVTTNTERFGRLQGVGWYGQLSFWCCGDPYANGDIGVTAPRRVELDRPTPSERSAAQRTSEAGSRARIPRGLELVAIASGINANYDGASREGSVKDAKTPRSNVAVYQLGIGGQYWFGRNFRAGLHYSAYLAPNAGTIKNLVALPSNVTDRTGNVDGGTASHELTLRLQAGF